MNRIMVIIAGVALAVVVAILLLVNKPKAIAPASTDAGSTSTSTSQSTSDASTVTAETSVVIQNYAYSPAKITVKKGTKVTWTNQDTVRHDVMSDDNSSQKGLESALLAKGQSYSFTFTTVGTYTYHCSPHPYMKATVEVTE